MTETVWFNQGYSVVRDALLLIREGSEAAGIGGLRLFASHADPHAPVLQAADQAFLEPAFDADDRTGAVYAAWCAAICAQRQIDLFMVQRRQQEIARNLHLFPAHTRVVLPASAEALALISDKAAFSRIAIAAGLPMAWTSSVATASEFDAAVAELATRGLRGCVKPREGVFGHGFWRLDECYTLMDALLCGDDRRIPAAAVRQAIAAATRPVELLVMEYLDGPEWSLDCVCEAGSIIAGVARRKRGRVQELEVDGPIFTLARSAVDLFGLSGLVNVQFRAADTAGEDQRLLEINPRMSGGVARSRFAGVNLPWRNLALLLGLDNAAEVDVPVGGALIAPHETGINLRPLGHEPVGV